MGAWLVIFLLRYLFPLSSSSSNFTILLDIEPDFKEQLKILIPLLLSPENLVPKEIGGNKVKAKELLHYFQSYMAIYKGDELPEPKSMLEVQTIIK